MSIAKSREEFWADIHPKYYKSNTKQAPSRKNALADMVHANDVESVLELGCNSGGNLLYMSRRNSRLQLAGIDVCKSAIMHGKRREKNPADLRVGSIYDLSKFPDNSFDLVFTCTVLIHIPTEKVQAILKEMVRISKKFVLHIEDNHEEEGVYWYREGVPQRWKTNYVSLYEGLGHEARITPMDDLIAAPARGGADHLITVNLTHQRWKNIMTPTTYGDSQYPSPKTLTNKHDGESALIIGTGHSTKNLVQYKDKLRDKFDVIVGLNFSTRDFEDELDYHMILEKNPVKSYEAMSDGNYRRDLPRILNWKSLDKFPDDIKAYKSTRTDFGGKPHIRKYNNNDHKGFLMGPKGNKGLSVGSVALNAIHFAGILGCKNVYLMGADFLFKDEFDHYYPDSHYRKSTTKLANRSPIITVQHNGAGYKTTKFFQESAEHINTVIDTLCKDANMNVYDFSDGLITSATSLDIDDFMR